MSDELFRAAIDQMTEVGVKQVDVVPTVGEILIDDAVEEKLRYAVSRGMRVHAFTNGLLLLRRENYKRLVDSRISQLIVSLTDLDSDEESRNLRISRDAAEKKMEGIRLLAEYNAVQNGIRALRLAFRPSRHPCLVRREPAFDVLARLGVSYDFLLRYDNWGGQVSGRSLRGIMRLITPRRFRRLPCMGLRDLSVMPSGSVRLCGCRCLDTLEDDLVVGNLSRSGLAGILSSDAALSVKASFAEGHPPRVCRQCTYYRPDFR